MSNYLGQSYVPAKPLTDENFNIWAQVAQMKQQTYNAKKNEIQQAINSFSDIELLRDSDREYMAAKISDTVNSLNQLGNRNLTEGNVADSITQSVKAIANDPIISNAIYNTQKFKNFQSQVQQVREKNKEGYSDINYNYALSDAGYNDYISGKTDNLGNLQYTNYSDYNKKVNDLILDLEAKKKDQVIEIPDGRGGVTQTTISGLSPVQVRSIAESMLDTNDRKQIEIDGWYNSGGYDNPEILNIASQKVNSDLVDIDNKISLLNTKIRQGGSPDDIATYTNELNTLASNKLTLQKNLDTYTKNPKVAATYIQQEKVYNGVVTRFAPIYTQSQKIVKDDVYWAQKNYQLDENKFALDASKFQYQQQQDAKKEAETLGGGDNLIVTTAGLETPGDIQSTEDEVNSTISTVSTELNSKLTAYKEALSNLAESGNEQAQTTLNLYNQRIAKKGRNQTDLDVFRAIILETDSTNDELSIIGDVNYKADIRALTDTLDLYVTGKTEAEKQSRVSHIDSTINTNEAFQAFYKNPNTRMLLTGADGVQRAVPVKDALISAGLMDNRGNKIGDIKTNPKLLDALEQSYYVDAALSKASISGDAITDIAKSQDYINKIARKFNENPNSVLVADNTVRPLDARDYYKPNLNTKTGRFIANAIRNKTYDTFGFSDNSLSGDDSTIKRFLEQDYRNTNQYKSSLENLRSKLPNSQVVGVAPAQEALYQKLQAVASSVNPTFKPSKEATVNIKDDGEYVQISTTNFTTKKEEFIPTESTSRVLKSDFQRNFPELTQKLDLQTKAAIYTYDKLQGRPLISPKVVYIQDNANDNYEWASEVLLRDRPALTPYLTSQDSKATLQNKYAAYQQNDPLSNEVINRAIDNSSNYGIKLEVANKFGTPKIFIKMEDINTKNLIHSIRIDGEVSADKFKPILDNAPQVYYSMLIDDILSKQQLTRINGSDYPAYTKLKQSLKIQQ